MSTFSLTEMIMEIEAQIETQYIGGAINWADRVHDGAWSKALDRYDKALTLVAQNLDCTLFAQESELYKTTVLSLLKLYKAQKEENEADQFVQMLRNKAGVK